MQYGSDLDMLIQDQYTLDNDVLMHIYIYYVGPKVFKVKYPNSNPLSERFKFTICPRTLHRLGDLDMPDLA